MRIKIMTVLFMAALLSSSGTVYAASQEKESTSNPLQQTIYFGGDILTMQGDQPEYVEAVMVHDGKIIYTGDKASAVNNFAGETIEVDLKGKTMLPAFCELKSPSTGSDSNATQPDPFFVMWTAIKKETGSGKVSGSEQTMAIYAALQNTTTGSACLFSEEERRGIIKKGLPADFVILDKSPLKVTDVDALREITVMETIKEGKTIYKKRTVDGLSGYFVKNTVKFDENYNFKHVVVTNQKDFDKYFGIAKTMKNRVDKVNFEEQSVIAIMTKSSKVPKTIEVVYFEFDGDKLFIQYHIKEGAKRSYESTGLYLAAIPKDVASVKFKSRYNVGIVDIK